MATTNPNRMNQSNSYRMTATDPPNNGSMDSSPAACQQCDMALLGHDMTCPMHGKQSLRDKAKGVFANKTISQWIDEESDEPEHK